MREMKNSGVEWIGKIPEEWTKDKVIRLFNVIGSGTTPKNITSDFPCVNWIQSGDINGSLISDCKNNISKSIVSQYSALKFYAAPFIVIAMYGASVGNISISLINGCVNQACCVLSTSICNLNYAFYAIKSSQNYLVRKAIGGGQPNINQDTIKQLWLPLPALPEQERIAAFLDAECAEIDAVLEKTRASIEEYKKLKQAVITQAVTKGIRDDRPMKDSGIEWIGEIPAEWKASKIKYCTEFAPSCNTSHLSEDRLVTFTPMECIKNGYFENREAPFSALSSSYTQYQEGDIVFAKVTPCFENGNIAIMQGLSAGFGFGSSELFVIRPQSINTEFIFYYLQNDIFKQYACATMTGTGGLKRVSPTFVRNYSIFIPSNEEQIEIVQYLNEKCSGIEVLIAKKQQYLTEIENYKKSLIYEYVTGQKEVKTSVLAD